mgnify:CR=1 FL=1
METNKDKANKSHEDAKPLEDRSGSDADKDTGITEGKYANIGSKQAGENNTEEEIKGSDADRAN